MQCPKCNSNMSVFQGGLRCQNCGHQTRGVPHVEINKSYISYPTITPTVAKEAWSDIHTGNAELIQGWMTREELAWLATQANKYKLIVEVGSYLGRSCKALADNTTGKIFAVDTWVGPLSTADRKTVPSFEAEFRKNLADEIKSGKVIPVTPDAKQLSSCKPDMVFLDGDHAYASVKKDLLFWKDRVKKGGLLCGHDISCEDVAKAVNEVLQKFNKAVGDIWFYIC